VAIEEEKWEKISKKIFTGKTSIDRQEQNL
jgi:hypothetical protein